MSVLEQFFQISMVFLLVTIGVNIMLTSFGQPMTGVQPTKMFPDYNAANVQLVSSYSSIIQQTSTAPTDLATTIATSQLGAITTNLYNFAFALQIVIFRLFSGYSTPGVENLTTFATALNGIITTIQVFGSIYLAVSLFTILRGLGGTP